MLSPKEREAHKNLRRIINFLVVDLLSDPSISSDMKEEIKAQILADDIILIDDILKKETPIEVIRRELAEAGIDTEPIKQAIRQQLSRDRE